MFNPINNVEFKISGYRRSGVILSVLSKVAYRYGEFLFFYVATFLLVILYFYPIKSWSSLIVIWNAVFFALGVLCFLCAYAHALIRKSAISNSLNYTFPLFTLLSIFPVLKFLNGVSLGYGAKTGILVFYAALLIIFINRSHRALSMEATKVNFALLQNEFPYKGGVNIYSKNERYEVKKCYVSFDLRPAIVTRPGVALYRKTVIDADTLGLYVGCERPLFFDRPYRINFQVSLIDNADQEHFLCGKSVSPMHNWEHTKWVGIEADVKRFLGQEVTIRLKSFSLQPQDQRKKIYWGMPSLSSSSRLSKARKNILILLDGCRPDYLGCYNAARQDASPHIDNFSKEAVMFTNAFSQGTWTLPSFISMFTGCFPSTTETWHPRNCRPLNEKAPILTNYFKKAGFKTAAFVSHQRGHPNYGFSEGFDSYYISQRDFFNGVSTAADLTDKAIDFLESTRNEDVFLLVHIFDTHAPFEITDYSLAKEEFERFNDNALDDKFWKDPRFLFRGSVRDADLCFSRFIEYLNMRGWYDNSAIIVSADHGKAFVKHKSGHLVYDNHIRVPLLLKYPAAFSVGRRKIDIPVEATNAFLPTFLDINGIACKDNIDGVSLHTYIKGDKNRQGSRQEDYAISEDVFPDYYSVACSTASDKLVVSLLGPKANRERWKGRKSCRIVEYYDLINDRSELEDKSASSEKRQRVIFLEKEIDNFLKNKEIRF